MGSRTWIKVYCDKWLSGTLREESPELRSVWIDLLALAGSGKYGDTGEVKLAEGVGLKDGQIAGILQIPPKLWLKNKQRLIESGRISVEENNIIRILNWGKYQSEYIRQRVFRRNQKLQPKVTTKSAVEKEIKEKEIKEKEIYIPYPEYPNVNKMTREEHQKLIEKFGEAGARDRVENLSLYIASKGDKYKNHYATILAWEKRDQRMRGSQGRASEYKSTPSKAHDEMEVEWGGPEQPTDLNKRRLDVMEVE